MYIKRNVLTFNPGETELLQHPFEGTSSKPGELAMALLYCIFSYGGW
jgi:hypothetical protein